MGIALALPLGASAAPPAHAARYTYELCDSALPGGNPPALTFVVNPGVPIGYFNTCSQPGGSIGVSEWGHTASTFAYLSVEVPETPGGFVETETISGAAGGLGAGNDHTFVYEQAWPQNNAGEQTRTFFIRRERASFFGNGGGFVLLMNCDGNYGPGCDAGPTIWAHDIAATEVDPKAPTLANVHGSLLGGGIVRGHQTLGVEANDEGGGLSKVEVLVNGLPASKPTAANCSVGSVANRSYKGIVATTLTPCPTNAKEEWTLNTEAPPFRNGANAVQVCASDFATIGEPNTACSTAQNVNVDNSCTNSPVTGGEVLSVQFAGSHGEEITVPFGHSATVTGELADNAGDAIGGATICVQIQTFGSRRALRPVAMTTTDAHGHFTYKVPPGPNRRVLVGYRHDTYQVARSVRYYAHARPSLRSSLPHLQNGGWIHFRGQLPGPRRRGRVVVLQANVLGAKRWITFRKTTSARKGIFRAAYHFISTTRTTVYRFRALVPRQVGYPWAQGHSEPVRVQVSR